MNGEQQNPVPGAPPAAGQVPPPPQTPDIQIRTMESDVQSVQETGGQPKPQYIDLPSGGLPATPSEPPPPPPSAPGGSGPAEPIAAPTPTPGWSWLVWLVIIIILIVLGWLAYVYLWPMILGPTGSGEAPLVEPAPPAQPLTTPIPAAPPRLSPFGSPLGTVTTLAVANYEPVAILTTLQNEAVQTPASGNIKELAIKVGAGPAIFSQFLAALIPELTGNGLAALLQNVFEDNFTTYFYYDDNGVWPGLVVALRKNVADLNPVTLANQLQLLELSSYSNLFLIPPGTAQTFRNNQLKDKYNYRLAYFSQPGAAFNYGLFDQYLIITTSVDGLLGVLQLLGL